MNQRLALLLATALALLLPSQAARSTTLSLADQPLFSTTLVPGNLALVLSVEWPTATTPAYPSTSSYSSASTYYGYFDPAKCYKYSYNSTTPASSYFAPYGAASSHTCSSTASTPLWSGNYMNWAFTQTLDAFRWVLTGGYRSVDTSTSTILTKTNALQNSTTMPEKTISSTSTVGGASPFSSFSYLSNRARSLGTALYVTGTGILDCTTMSTTTGGTNKFTCYTGTGEYSCSSSGTNICTAAISTSYNLSCARTTSGSTHTYTCQSIDTSSNTPSSQCQNTATTSTTATVSTSCTPSTSGNYPVVDYNGQSSAASTAATGTVYRVYGSVKVCDSSVGIESNCVAYGSSYKPEGLMQTYSSKLRYSAFGYYNHDGTTSQQRDGGIMRARMKYIGPTQPVPGSSAITNAATEWSSTDGTMYSNPDSSDATATNTFAKAATWTTSVSNSGVMNYLNKFGYSSTSYKSKDPVSELYYTALRYFKNLGNVASYTTLSGAGSSSTAATWLDGFPAITSWDDPILYSCQKNFILGIGDVNTHRDTNLYGSTLRSSSSLEPSLPSEVAADTSVNVATATNMVGQLEGLTSTTAGTASLANVFGDTSSTACADTGKQCNGYYMAGLAYDAHTVDIRSDLSGTQTVNTYWMDVLEGQVYKHKNQYWLAAKYGGFTVPSGFSPYSSSNTTTTLSDSTWYTSTDTLSVGTTALSYSTDSTNGNTTSGTDKRPDNYFPGNRPDLMKTGLTAAFAKIASELTDATSTAFSTASPNETLSGASFAATYNPKTWTGTVVGSAVSYDSSTGAATLTSVWDASSLLDNTTYSSRKIVTCCTSSGAALPFTYSSLSGATLLARTDFSSFSSLSYLSTQSATNYVNYLRGQRTNEASYTSGVYRTRSHVLGDIVNAKVLAVGPPSAAYYDSSNPGYSTFKSTYASRTPVVFVGANDGMLHALNGSVSSSNTAAGTELFAYIPSFAFVGTTSSATTGLAALGNPSFTHYYRVDATPQSADVNFNQTSSTSTTTGDWHTMLVGGLGKGGKGYYAIDITDPTAWTTETAVASKVLWEFTASTMGYTYGTPQIAKTAKYGWVALLTSGYNNSDGKGYLYIVNIKTGALLETIVTPEGSTSAPINLAHITGFVPSSSTNLIEAVYAADMLGNVWRYDLSGTSSYSSPTKIAKLTDRSTSANNQPVTAPIEVTIDSTTGKRYVLIGTGTLLADSDISSSLQQSFYAIVDGTKTAFLTSSTLPTGYSFPLTRSQLTAVTDVLTGTTSATMGWYFDLPVDSASSVAYRITTIPTVSYGTVAFAATLPNGEACNPSGSSRVYAVAMSTGVSTLSSTTGYLTYNNVVTDLSFKNVNGTIRLYVGTSAGGNPDTQTPTQPTLSTAQRLNWREVPSAE